MGVLGAGGWAVYHTYRGIVRDIGRQQQRARDRAASEFHRQSADFDRRYQKQRAEAVEWPSPRRPEAGALLLLESLAMRDLRVSGRWVDGTIDIIASDRDLGRVVCRVTSAEGGQVTHLDIEALLALARMHHGSPMLLAQRPLDSSATRIAEELEIPVFLLGCTEWGTPEPSSTTARGLLAARWKNLSAMGNDHSGVVGPFSFDASRWRREDEEDAAARLRREAAARDGGQAGVARPLHPDELYDGSTACPSCGVVPPRSEVRCPSCGTTRRPMPSLAGPLAPAPDLELTDEAHAPPRPQSVPAPLRKRTRREVEEERRQQRVERRKERRQDRAGERRRRAVASGERWKCPTCGYRSRADATTCFMCGTQPD